MQILLVDDDLPTAEFAERGLTRLGNDVDIFKDGVAALAQALSVNYDLMIVDCMLPDMSGTALVRDLRAVGIFTPVLFLDETSSAINRVECLNAGGNDYLNKPFSIAELLARVNALSRQTMEAKDQTDLQVGDLNMNLLNRTVERNGFGIQLQSMEFGLLEMLMRNAGNIVSRSMLLEQVWDFHFDPKTSVVETHICRLRSKIDQPFDSPLLHTVRNIGYRLHPSV